jgi:Tol biopolymer transport system component
MDRASAAAVIPLVHAGETIDHYEIVSFIGRGGMGEVYEARDKRLARSVALKILPAVHGDNIERVRRFAQEVRTTSRLSHPNIVSIFDAGEYQNRPYLVTELLEGETLRIHIARSAPLPVRRAVAIALQIVRGLAAADDKGIIHRDLKPANVFVSTDGHVKILDFGLAKLIHGQGNERALDDDTISLLSMPGAVMGSVGYMSPEQVEARTLDARSDVFSLGAIFYEMLSGKRAFSGSSSAAVCGSILKDEPPDIASLRPDMPPALAAIINRCLKKMPEDRFQTARDLAFSLEEMDTRSGGASFSSSAIRAYRGLATRVQRKKTTTALAITAVLGLLTLLADGRSGATPQNPAGPPVAEAQPRLTRLTSSGRVGYSVAISPDAKYVVFADARGTDEALMLLHVPTGSMSELTRAAAASSPVFGAAAFSRDGNYIYVVRSGAEGSAVIRMPLLGGTPEIIAEDAESSSLSISRTGAEIAFLRTDETRGTSSLLLSSSDGSSERLLASRPGMEPFFSCHWTNDSRDLLCSAVSHAGGGVGVKVDAATGVQRAVSEFGAPLTEYLAGNGSVIGPTMYGSGSQILRVDNETRETTRVTNDLSLYGPMDISADGSTVAAIRLDSSVNLWSVAVDDPSRQRQITAGSNTMDGNYGVAVAAGNRIIWSANRTGRSFDLWSSEPDGSNPRRLTFDDSADERWPMTSTRTSLIAYIRDSRIEGRRVTDIWVTSPDGSGGRALTVTGDALPPRFAAGGQSVVFNRRSGETAFAFEITVEGGVETRLDEKPTGVQAAPSPDGKWLLTESDLGTGLELRPYKRSGASRPLPLKRTLRRWSPDGSAIAHLGPGGLWVFHLDGRPPKQLTDLPAGQSVTPGFDWTPDGREIVFARRDDRREVVLIQGVK